MRKYIIVFEKAFKSKMIYRSAALSSAASTVLSFGIQLCLWRALLGTELHDGTSFQDMVFFLVINTFVSVFTYANIASTIEAAVMDGSIVLELPGCRFLQRISYLLPFRYISFEPLNPFVHEMLTGINPAYVSHFTLSVTMIIYALIAVEFQPSFGTFLVWFLCWPEPFSSRLQHWWQAR